MKLKDKVVFIANEISPDFIGDKPEDMEEGTISPDPMFHSKDIAQAINDLKAGLWNLETINRHQENFKGLLPIRAIEKEIDKIFGDFEK